MCLAVPGRITEIDEDAALGRAGKVSFGGVIKEANLSCVPEAVPGDYVLVHAGFALSIVDEQEANQVLGYLEALAAAEEEGVPS
jgi:hydrogenase expression/formation protein HypC